jgi:hypothetical protein
MAFFEMRPPFHTRDRLLTISPATIDRTLKEDWKKLALTRKNRRTNILPAGPVIILRTPCGP